MCSWHPWIYSTPFRRTPTFSVLHRAKNHFAIGRNSERCSWYTDKSWIILPISDPSALNFSQSVGFQNTPNLSKVEKVAETCEFDGKEPLFVERTIAISKRVVGWKLHTWWVAAGGQGSGFECYGVFWVTMTSYTKRCTISWRVCWCNPLHTIKFISDSDILFPYSYQNSIP